jgi:ribose 5-phosphate isomerase B
MLALGTRIVDNAAAITMVREFMGTEFAGGRHQRRIDKISALDESK